MHPLLDTYDLLDYVEGKLPAPTETHKDGTGQLVSNLAYKQWKSHDKFALTCLMLSVTEEVGCNLLAAKTSHEAWTTLATLFDSQTTAQEDFLDQQWRDLRKGSLSTVDFIHSVKQLATSFAQIGKPKTAAQIIVAS